MDIKNERHGRNIKETATPPFRSKLEERVAKNLEEYGIDYVYEPTDRRIGFLVPAVRRSYLPDFILKKKDGSEIFIEVKGRWTFDDRRKHLLIRQQHPELDIRFVFQRASNTLSKSSKTTYRDICEGNGRGDFKGVIWKYSDGGVIPKEWLIE